MISGNRVDRAVRTRVIPPIVLALSFCCAMQADAAEKVLYAFKGGSDGAAPQAGVIMDGTGNFYGTTEGGGTGTNCFEGNTNGCGAIFQIAPGGAETVLYSFQGGSDGAFPSAGLYDDGQGTLFGTTAVGGTANVGTVYRLVLGGSETVLYSFQGGSDGSSPQGSLIADANGNLFGETLKGGSYNGSLCSVLDGCGTVFELKPDGTKIVLYAFQGGSDGAVPSGGLIADQSGNLYGTAEVGGDLACGGIGGGDGCGVVFKVAPDGTETVLYAFQGGADGGQPQSALVSDASGNFYGTTVGGGNTQCLAPAGCGVVFKLAPDGTESALHAFQSGSDGDRPLAGVVKDKSGNLYGTTEFGGTGCSKHYGCGTVFKVAPDGTETVLVAFSRSQGTFPTAPLLQKKGILYGTTSQGGAQGDGVVFKLKK